MQCPSCNDKRDALASGLDQIRLNWNSCSSVGGALRALYHFGQLRGRKGFHSHILSEGFSPLLQEGILELMVVAVCG